MEPNNKLSTAERKVLFAKHYQLVGSLGEAAALAGIKSRKTVYLWIEKDATFAELYQELKANRADQIKSKLYLSATGQLALTQPQVTSAIFLLKAFDPKQFAEKYQMQHSGAGGETLKIEFVPAKRNDETG